MTLPSQDHAGYQTFYELAPYSGRAHSIHRNENCWLTRDAVVELDADNVPSTKPSKMFRDLVPVDIEVSAIVAAEEPDRSFFRLLVELLTIFRPRGCHALGGL